MKEAEAKVFLKKRRITKKKGELTDNEKENRYKKAMNTSRRLINNKYKGLPKDPGTIMYELGYTEEVILTP